MEAMPVFTQSDLDILMQLSIFGAIMPDEVKSVEALRDKLDAALERCFADDDDDEGYWDDDEDDWDG